MSETTKAMKTETLIANLKAALLAAGTDIGFPYLACVRIEATPTTMRFVATNGHWLWVNEEPFEYHTSFVLHVALEDAKRLVKAVPKRQNVTLDHTQRIICGIQLAIHDIDFPPYQQVLPREISATQAALKLDASYVADIAQAFSHVAESRKPAVCIEILSAPQTDPQRPGPSVVTSAKAPNALAILMHVREDDTDQNAILARYRS